MNITICNALSYYYFCVRDSNDVLICFKQPGIQGIMFFSIWSYVCSSNFEIVLLDNSNRNLSGLSGRFGKTPRMY